MPLFISAMVLVKTVQETIPGNRSVSATIWVAGRLADGAISMEMSAWPSYERGIETPYEGQQYWLDGRLTIGRTGSFVVEAVRLCGMPLSANATPIEARITGTGIVRGPPVNDSLTLETASYAMKTAVTVHIKCVYNKDQYGKFIPKIRNGQEIFFSGVLGDVDLQNMTLTQTDMSFLSRASGTQPIALHDGQDSDGRIASWTPPRRRISAANENDDQHPLPSHGPTSAAVGDSISAVPSVDDVQVKLEPLSNDDAGDADIKPLRPNSVKAKSKPSTKRIKRVVPDSE